MNASEASGSENYSKYADYTPVRAEPAEIVPGENYHVLVAYFSRSGNTDISTDAVSSACLAVNDDGTAAGNAHRMAEWIAQETGGDLFLIQIEYTYPVNYDQTVKVGEGQDIDGYCLHMKAPVCSLSDRCCQILVTQILLDKKINQSDDFNPFHRGC